MLGIPLHDICADDLVGEMVEAMAARRRLLVLHANAWLLTLARQHPSLQPLFRRADIVYADGAGAVLAAKLLTGRSFSRSTAPDWIDELGRRMASQGSSVFWLGGREPVVARAARAHARATGVRIAGWHDGYFDLSAGSADNLRLIEQINASGADFLVVNMGMPLQEIWLKENWDSLNVSVALAAGALVDRVAGLVGRPPGWMTRCGLEWLARLVSEPRRLWRRYLIGLPVFLGQILQEVVRRRLGLHG